MTGPLSRIRPVGPGPREPVRPVRSVRPVLALDVDGVFALQDPAVPVVRHTVSAYGRWRREILIPTEAGRILGRLAASFDPVWVGAWAHTAHPALQSALDLPEQPWPWLGVQFHKLAAIRTFAAGRPWAWIDDSIDDLAPVGPQPDGVLVRVDSRRGVAEVDPDALLAAVMQLPQGHSLSAGLA